MHHLVYLSFARVCWLQRGARVCMSAGISLMSIRVTHALLAQWRARYLHHVEGGEDKVTDGVPGPPKGGFDDVLALVHSVGDVV